MACCGARHAMKLKDKDIENERVRERELETETVQHKPSPEITQHFSHPHPLIYTESTDHARFRCNMCTLSGPGTRYHCAVCNFSLHKVCAQTPVTFLLDDKSPDEVKTSLHQQREVISNSFAHPDHPVVAEYSTRSFRCDHCNDSGDGLRFRCETCNVGFHRVCIKHPTRMTSYLHQHELELKLRPQYGTTCYLCGLTGHKNNFMYRCKKCQFYVHPDCSEWPLYVIHPLHAAHPLVLRPCAGRVYNCSFCNWPTDGYMYSCEVCDVYFDPNCISKKSKLGLPVEVKQKYEGQMIMLPITNLTSPRDISVSHSDSMSPALLAPFAMLAISPF